MKKLSVIYAEDQDNTEPPVRTGGGTHPKK